MKLTQNIASRTLQYRFIYGRICRVLKIEIVKRQSLRSTDSALKNLNSSDRHHSRQIYPVRTAALIPPFGSSRLIRIRNLDVWYVFVTRKKPSQ